MARMIDTKPSYNGEAILWEKLQAFLPARDLLKYESLLHLCEKDS